MAFDASTIFNGIVQVLQTVLSWITSMVMSFAPPGFFDLVLLGVALIISWALVKWKNFAGYTAIVIIGGFIYLVLKLA